MFSSIYSADDIIQFTAIFFILHMTNLVAQTQSYQKSECKETILKNEKQYCEVSKYKTKQYI